MIKNKLKKLWYGLLSHYIFLVPYIVIKLIVIFPYGIIQIIWEEIIFPICDRFTLSSIKQQRQIYKDKYVYYKHKCGEEHSND